MEDRMFITADEIAENLGISKPFAYKLIKQMNEQLIQRGYMIVSGRVSRRYYEEKFYGAGSRKEKTDGRVQRQESR